MIATAHADTGTTALLPGVRFQIGQRLGKLVVLGYAGSSLRGDRLWWCQCDCGAKVKRPTVHLNAAVDENTPRMCWPCAQRRFSTRRDRKLREIYRERWAQYGSLWTPDDEDALAEDIREDYLDEHYDLGPVGVGRTWGDVGAAITCADHPTWSIDARLARDPAPVEMSDAEVREHAFPHRRDEEETDMPEIRLSDARESVNFTASPKVLEFLLRNLRPGIKVSTEIVTIGTVDEDYKSILSERIARRAKGRKGGKASVRARRGSPAVDRVLAYFKANPGGLYVGDVAKAMDLAESTTRAHCCTLSVSGQLVRVSKGTYRYAASESEAA